MYSRLTCWSGRGQQVLAACDGHLAMQPLRNAAWLGRTMGATQVRAAANPAYSARTDDTLLRSPPDVIATKQQQLAKVGPSPPMRQLLLKAACVPAWAALALQLTAGYLKSPSTFRQADPSQFQLQPPFPLEEELISVNGIKLHVVSPGRRPSKPLLLFVHGFPECWYSWRHQMSEFKEDWDVVALDMRGYNDSDKPQGVEQYHLSLLASDLAEAVRALGHSSCTLVAHDWGGMVAWTTAGLYGGELLDGLVVMGLPHYGVALTNASSEQDKRSSYILTFQAVGLAEQLLTANNGAIMEDFFRAGAVGIRNKRAMSSADVDWYRAAITKPGAAQAILTYYRALFRLMTGDGSGRDEATWKALRRPLTGLPVLVLHGEDDVALGQELLRGIEAAAPQAEVHLLSNCSHWIQQDYPEQTNQIMRSWFAEQGLQGQGAVEPAGAAAQP